MNIERQDLTADGTRTLAITGFVEQLPPRRRGPGGVVCFRWVCRWPDYGGPGTERCERERSRPAAEGRARAGSAQSALASASRTALNLYARRSTTSRAVGDELLDVTRFSVSRSGMYV